MNVRDRLLSLALIQGEATIVLDDGHEVTGTVTFVGENKFRLDTPLAANFIPYEDVKEVV